MTRGVAKKDLVVLVADKNMEYAVRGILSRSPSLYIRSIEAEIHVHVRADPGCYHRGDVFLRPFSYQFAYGMILLDREGSGQENKGREELEQEIEQKLKLSGWAGRSASVVIDPELDNWVWSDSPLVDRILGWEHCCPDLRTSLLAEGRLAAPTGKPPRPKEALEWSLRRAGKPRSSAIYEELASVVSLDHCVDPAFLKLKRCLQQWFGAQGV